MTLVRMLGTALLVAAAPASLASAAVQVAATGTSFAAAGTSSVRLVDLDGDGNLDIVTGSTASGGMVGIRLGDGHGGFTAATGITDQTADRAHVVTVADADGDGRKDLIGANNATAVFVWHRLPGPGLAFESIPTTINDSSLGTSVRAVISADATGDGDTDLLVGGDLTSRLSPKLGGAYPGGSRVDLTSYPTGAIRSADVTGDGTADIVSVTWDPLSAGVSRIIVQPVTPGVGIASSQVYPLAGRARDVALADMDGDGDRDVVIAYDADMNATPVGIAWNDGSGAFTLGPTTTVGTSASVTQLAVTDVNGDYLPDVVAATSAGPRLVPGTGVHATPFGTPVALGSGLSGSEVAVGDLDGDGRPDLVSGASSGVEVRLNTTPASASLTMGTPFGSVLVGAGADRSLTITNTGDTRLAQGAPVFTGADASSVSVQAHNCTGTLAPSASCGYTLRFSPTARGALDATVTFPSITPTPDTPLSLSLTGRGIIAGTPSTPASVDAGEVTVGATATRTVTLTNAGDLAFTPPAATLTGSSEWSITADPCAVSLAAAATCTVTVAVTPTTTGAVDADLHVGAATTTLHATAVAAPVTGDRDPVTPTTPAPAPVTTPGTTPLPATTAPRITGRPRISFRGVLRRGTRLTATAVATGTPRPTLTYRWQRCTGARCTVVAAGARYTVTGADRGRRLKVTVVATSTAGSVFAASSATAVVASR